MDKIEIKKIANILLNDGIGVLPTDTLYGLVGRAFSRKAFDRIFELKKRNPKNPFIILISSIKDLDLFDIKVNENAKKMLEKYWPGKVSIILPCDNEKFSYLHMGTKTLAFRTPDKKDLLKILEKTGPLLAPSVNHPGEKEALTIEEAKKYFGSSVDFYVDEGKLESLPSTLIKIENGKIVVLREGAVEIE
ncbi:MAG: L-threonylcarbamoyladenylate synthase [Patescibacteria group bacterium]